MFVALERHLYHQLSADGTNATTGQDDKMGAVQALFVRRMVKDNGLAQFLITGK